MNAGVDGLDATVLVWNGVVARVPALAIQPTSVPEVVAAVGFARDHGLLLSVKGASRSAAGTSAAERAVTLDLSRMREVAIDLDAGLVHAGPGCLPGEVERAAQVHGLAVTWQSDDLEEVEIVAADGSVRIANRDENADVFRALRGGARDVGVVTRLTFRLAPRDRGHGGPVA
jgi:FAD/FMN-containing dehydrogenase